MSIESRTGTEQRENLSPAQERQGNLESTARKLDGDQCLVGAQVDCADDLLQVAGDVPPPTLRESLDTQRESLAHRERQSEIPDPVEIVEDSETSGDVLETLGLSDGEQAVLEDIRSHIKAGNPLTPEQQNVIDHLGGKIEERGAEKVKSNIVRQYPDIPQVSEMTPKEAVQFAEQYGKVEAIFKYFNSVESETGIVYGVRNWFSETFKGNSLLERGKIGTALNKLKSGQLLSETEMKEVDTEMKDANEEARVQMYQGVIADMLERMIPGMNIAKDGLTGEALTADAINTISVLAMLVTGGGTMVARMGINAQRIANGIIKADVAATAYGLGEGVVGMDKSLESGDTSGMALNGAMMIMSALGLKAGISGMGMVANSKRMDMLEDHELNAQTTRGESVNRPTKETIRDTFEFWDPKYTNVPPERTREFIQNIGSEMIRAQGQVAQIFDGIGEKWTIIGSGAINRPKLNPDDVDINFTMTYAPQIRAKLEDMVQKGEIFVKRLDKEGTPLEGVDRKPIFDVGFNGKPLENGTPKFAFWTKLDNPDGSHKMVEVEMFGEGIRHTDGKTIGITQITSLEGAHIERHRIRMPNGEVRTLNMLSETGLKAQYAHNLMSEFRGDTLQSYRTALAEGKAPKAKDLMRFSKLQTLDEDTFAKVRGVIEETAQKFDRTTVAKEYKDVFGDRQAVFDLMEKTQGMYRKETPRRGRINVDVARAKEYLGNFPRLFEDLKQAKLDMVQSFDSLSGTNSIESLYGNFARVRDQMTPFEGLNQFLRTNKPENGALHFMATERYFSDFVHDYGKKLKKYIGDIQRKATKENRQLTEKENTMIKEIMDRMKNYNARSISVTP